MNCTGRPKCAREEQASCSRNLEDETLFNQHGLLSPEKQRNPAGDSSAKSFPITPSARRRFTAEEKGKAIVLAATAAADPPPTPSLAGARPQKLKLGAVARDERIQQVHFGEKLSGPGRHSVKAASTTPSGGTGGLADTSLTAPVADEGWEEVKGKYGWRSGGPGQPQNLPPTSPGLAPSSSSSVKQQQASVFTLQSAVGDPSVVVASPGPFRALFVQKAADRCFRCLASDHKVAECRNPPRCILCLNSGHRARSCRSSYHDRRPEVQTTPINRAPLPNKKMDFILPGAAHQRPEKVRAYARFSGAMAGSERDFTRHAVIGVVTGTSPAVSHRQVSQALAVRLKITEDEMNVGC